MQKNKSKNQKPVELIHKPIIPGTWNGKDAWKLGFKRMLSVLGISVLYVLVGAVVNFDSVILRALFALMIVFSVAYYQYASGITKGASDAAFGEILHSRRESGHEIPKDEISRSFHPLKGLFAVAIGCLPFVLFAIVFACLTDKVSYQLGALPAWTQTMMNQTEFAAPLAYYGAQSGMDAVSIMRIMDRAMIMPFVSVVTIYGANAVLLAERLSPLFILIAPMGYAVGYAMGQVQRDRINTGIKMGDDKKKRKERKARKQRQRSNAPERLI